VSDYAIFVLDTAGRVASWNAGAERVMGYAADEIIGEHCSRFYTPGDVEGGKPESDLRAAEAEGDHHEEGWRVRKGGGEFWAEVLTTPLRDAGGRLRGFSKVTRDVTERKRLEAEGPYDMIPNHDWYVEQPGSDLEETLSDVAYVSRILHGMEDGRRRTRKGGGRSPGRGRAAAVGCRGRMGCAGCLWALFLGLLFLNLVLIVLSR